MEIISGKRNTATPALLSDVCTTFATKENSVIPSPSPSPYIHEMGTICPLFRPGNLEIKV